MTVKKGGLGRGLDSLFETESEKGVTEIMLSEIEPNRDQPRKTFDEKALSELSDSIKKHGLIQPIVVTQKASGRYEIIAGERRWRASRMAGLRTVPVVVKELTDKQAKELALIENLQREDLNPVEEALGFRSLMVSYKMTQEELAETMGKSRSAIANTLRLLELMPEELEALRQDKFSAGHARALLSAEKGSALRKSMLLAAISGASVRELEAMLKEKKVSSGHSSVKPTKSNFYTEVELSLKEELGRKVIINPKGKGKGTITLEFYSDDELKDFAKRLAD